MLAAGLVAPAPAARRDAPGDRRPDPDAEGPSVLLDAGANADARPEHLLQFALHGRDLRRGDPRARRARGAPALDRRGAREGQRAHARGARAARRAASSTSAATPRAATCSRGAADVVVCDGFTGNVALKLLEGTIETLLDALRDRDRGHAARQARRPADPAGRAAAADAARPRHVRRRLPARPARARR